MWNYRVGFDVRGQALPNVIGTVCARVLPQVRGLIEQRAREYLPLESGLAKLMLDYPLRPAKGLRPALCLATTEALGGNPDALLPSAAAIELLHNAFLIHDDTEDESLVRRGGPALQRAFGVPTAINVADGMFALALFPLLDNSKALGLGPAYAILRLFAETVLQTVAGQELELGWIRANTWSFTDSTYRQAYRDMATKKTAIYSFATPVAVACIATRTEPEIQSLLESYAVDVGLAFQITDDILNLTGEQTLYGKESDGDLWEGKRTLILLHALTTEGDTHERAAALAALQRSRSDKTEEDVQLLRRLIRRHGSIALARREARLHCEAAEERLREVSSSLHPGEARDFLHALVPFVVERLH